MRRRPRASARKTRSAASTPSPRASTRSVRGLNPSPRAWRAKRRLDSLTGWRHPPAGWRSQPPRPEERWKRVSKEASAPPRRQTPLDHPSRREASPRPQDEGGNLAVDYNNLGVAAGSRAALALRARRGYIPANGDDHLLLRRGSDRRAKDDGALRLSAGASGRHARAIQSLEKNQANGNGFAHQARAAYGTGPVDDRTKRQGARETSARAPWACGRPARGGRTPHARGRARVASRGTLVGRGPASRRGGIGRDGGGATADACEQSLIFYLIYG